MKEFSKKLKTVIKMLPIHDPDSETWEVICKRLDFNEKIAAKVLNMPVHEPNENVWIKIEPQLKPKLKISRVKYLMVGLSAAASIILFFSLWFWNHQNPDEIITTTEEIVNDWHLPFIAEKDTASQTALHYINSQCKNKSYICNTPGFEEKKKELQEVETQIKMIQNVIKTSGNSPSLVKSGIKLENLKIRLMKDLLNIVAS